jgi:hypothetical protein
MHALNATKFARVFIERKQRPDSYQIDLDESFYGSEILNTIYELSNILYEWVWPVSSIL